MTRIFRNLNSVAASDLSARRGGPCDLRSVDPDLGEAGDRQISERHDLIEKGVRCLANGAGRIGVDQAVSYERLPHRDRARNGPAGLEFACRAAGNRPLRLHERSGGHLKAKTNREHKDIRGDDGGCSGEADKGDNRKRDRQGVDRPR